MMNTIEIMKKITNSIEAKNKIRKNSITKGASTTGGYAMLNHLAYLYSLLIFKATSRKLHKS